MSALRRSAEGGDTTVFPQRLTIGTLEARLAENEAEIRAAQRLRYRVFYEEMKAKASAAIAAEQRDFDEFDDYCDHLLVLDHKLGEGPESIIGTYRLLRRSVADRHRGFYTESEFDITPLKNVPGELLELGRSCVDSRYRTRPTMQLLWAAIAAYVFTHDIKIMFGCGSLPGTDPQAVAGALSYLHHNHLAPPEIRVRALPHRYVDMNLRAPDSVSEADAASALDTRAVLAGLPPLIKGYLRLGGLIGDGAVIDPEFNTVDVCIIVVTDRLTEKYVSHYRRKLSTE
ncbi:MAG: GNAT family N-acetyltransferase [Alphaproteobacteria bacterium]|nr:GNAT family N-acetyltransferase [Alphaproteobacteria bacterium]